MVINIDISIADSDGTVLHHFENRFNEKDACFEKQDQGYTDEIDFQNFLAEYLSCSGFAVREKLIYSKNNYVSEQNKSELSTYVNFPGEKEAFYRFEDSELEYKIRIGDKKVLVGKIPLKLPLIISDDVPEPKDKDTHTPLLTNNSPNAIDSLINYTMMKAIEKYEANLYPAWIEVNINDTVYALEE